MRALRERPTTLERWPKGVHDDIVVATRESREAATPSTRSGCRRALLTTSRPRGSSSPPAATRTRSARPSWRSSPGARTWARSPSTRGPCAAPTSTTPTSSASTSTHSPAPTSTTPPASPREARTLLGELGYAGFPKTSGGRGIHIYVRVEPRWTFTDMRHAAIAFGRELERRMPEQVTTKWWKEERGEKVFVDYNQNARDRTIASALQRPAEARRDRLRAAALGRGQRGSARGLHGRVDAGPLRRGRRPLRRDRRRPPLARAAARDVRAGRIGGRGRHALPARTTRRCRASRSACSPRATGTARARRGPAQALTPPPPPPADRPRRTARSAGSACRTARRASENAANRKATLSAVSCASW